MGTIGTFYASLPKWLQGLLVAVEGGLVGFLIQWASNPEAICWSSSCLKKFGGAIGGVIVMSIRNWLKQSPLPRDVWTGEQRAVVVAAHEPAEVPAVKLEK
jgi:hypothetical protein